MPTRLAALLLAAGLLTAAARAQAPSPAVTCTDQPRLVLTAYQVADLVIPVGGDKTPKTDEARLVKLIQDTVAAKSWASAGGRGTIDYFPMTMTLVVSQSPDVQEQIAELLAKLRREQDTQVALEVRVVTIPDSLFERVGVDFGAKPDGEQCPARASAQATTESAPCPPDKGVPLSDRQLFLFLEAAQGDQRTNVMQAPKVTALSGQTAVVDTTTKHIFVTGLESSRREGHLTIVPKTEEIATGFRMSARPVVSADRRQVQVELKVEQADLASPVVPLFPITWQSGAADEQGKPVQFTQFLQQPVVNKQCVEGKVTIPDGGTVLLGGLKKVTESRNEYGPPVLSKVPYMNRLFKNVGYGRETQNLYVLVTPRVIVTEEEECRPPACSRCKNAPAGAEESEACAPACRPGPALAALLKAYDEACAAGRKDEAAKLAQAALILDPTCFAKGRGRLSARCVRCYNEGMPSDILSCPYCNSAVAAPAGARPGQRIPCPRCGESFPLRERPPDEPGPAAPPPPPAEAPPPAGPRLSNGRLALLILGGMLGMALIGLAYALHTQALRRSYDLQLPKSRSVDVPIVARVALGLYVAGLVGAIVWGWNRRERAVRGENRPWTSRVGVPALAVLSLVAIGLALLAIRARPVRPPLDLDHLTTEVVAPADLAALGYLPDDTDLIVAVHVAEARDTPAGRDLLGRVGLGGAGAADLERWTGLKLDEVDHAALGLKLDDELLTRFVLVVRARRAIDEQRVRGALKAEDKKDVDGRPAYPFELKTGLDLVPRIGVSAWFADDHTLVIAKQFDRVPLTPRPGIDHLRSAALRQVVKERMRSPTHAWLAAHVDSWDGLNTFLRKGLETELGRDADTFKKVRTLALWVTADDGVTLRGALDCADDGAAGALQAYLDPANRRGLRLLIDPGQAGPAGRELLASLKTAREGTWVDLQAKASAEPAGAGK